MSTDSKRDGWGSRIGVILAVMGSAIGLGNFLRFPGQVAKYGGGTYLIPYLVALLIVGIPLAWMEWGLGRYGGGRGRNSAPGIFRLVTGRRGASYLGMFGTVMPVMIYMYYVFVEAWCLSYAWNYLSGGFKSVGGDAGRIGQHFMSATGGAADGAVFSAGLGGMLPFMLACFALNFFLIYRGIRRGIEIFCKVAMPLLFVCALIVLVRVLTLPPNPAQPDWSVVNGLGYMWNPTKPGETLLHSLGNAEVWIAATGQIFFSISLGFGLILAYSSYLKPDDDVALSSLTSVAGNEFSEVVLGGLIAIPAAFVFLGPAIVQSPPGTFGLGFVTLPNVFNLMPAGSFFGFIFFFLLFLAAVTSSVSMLQPAIALLEEGLGLTRKPSVAILGLITLMGSLFIVYFSKDFTALDTVDFWMANFFIFLFALAQTVVFGWVLGRKRGLEEIRRGAEIRVPSGVMLMIRYVSPLYLLVIFLMWCRQDLPGRVRGIFTLPKEGPPVVAMSVGLILIVQIFFAFVVARANEKWDAEEKRP